jgi:hypothetical protein
MLWLNLIVASVMVVLTFTIHFMGLVGLSAVLRQRGVHPVNLKSVFAQGVSILFVVISLFALHSIQIWAYAFVYLPHDDWRMLGAAEGANGFLLIGWSTAFLVAVTARVRAFEADIERLDD